MKRFVLLLVVPAVAVAAGIALWLQGGRYEETENAYVKAHMIAVSADVSGRVVDVRVRDNEPVAAGAPLSHRSGAVRAAVARAEAEMAVVRTTLEGLRAEHRVALADAAEAQERIGFLARQLERQQKLKERGMGLEASFDEARHNLEAARRRLESAHEKAARVLAVLGDSSAPPRRTRASSRRAPRATPGATSCARACRRSRRQHRQQHAPAGRRARRARRARVQPDRVAADVDRGELQETQLTHMREGRKSPWSPTPIRKAAARPRQHDRARHQGRVHPSGANSSGTVKVVQRVPVLIHLDALPDGHTPLRAGMTVTARVDTGHVRTLSALR